MIPHTYPPVEPEDNGIWRVSTYPGHEDPHRKCPNVWCKSQWHGLPIEGYGVEWPCKGSWAYEHGGAR